MESQKLPDTNEIYLNGTDMYYYDEDTSEKGKWNEQSSLNLKKDLEYR